MRPLAGILALSLLLAPQSGVALAEGASFIDGERAFQQRDYHAAKQVWTALAATNDPRAAFGLGLMNDLGLGGEPAPEEAFRCYLAAAEGGHALGMLNAAIMLDAGIGVARSPERAVIWYERAAAAGQPRAQYNLGQIFETGSGAPRNPAIAAAWFAKAAADLPAAADRLAPLRAEARRIALSGPPKAPEPHEAFTARALPAGPGAAGGRTDWRAFLAWTPAPNAAGSDYYLEIAELDGDHPAPVYAARHNLSSVVVDLGPSGGAYAWRASTIGPEGDRYAPSPWRRFQAGVAEADRGAGAMAELERWGLPKLAIRFREDDLEARILADELAADFAANGIKTRTEARAAAEAERSRVSYFHPADRDLAEAVSLMLPVIGGDAELASGEAAPPPGEVEIWLTGGVRPAGETGANPASRARAGQAAVEAGGSG